MLLLDVSWTPSVVLKKYKETKTLIQWISLLLYHLSKSLSNILAVSAKLGIQIIGQGKRKPHTVTELSSTPNKKKTSRPTPSKEWKLGKVRLSNFSLLNQQTKNACTITVVFYIFWFKNQIKVILSKKQIICLWNLSLIITFIFLIFMPFCLYIMDLRM